MVDNQRRTLLRTLGITATVGLSGCSQLFSENTENDSEVSTTPEQNQTETETPEPDIPESYRADRKRKANTNAALENIGDYQTEQTWDDLVTNTEKIQQAQQNWTNQQAYTPLVDKIMEEEGFEAEVYPYPNFSYEENDRGSFNPAAAKEEDDFEQIVRWYLPAIMQHDRDNYGNAPSSRNDRFATTLEKLINEHHPSAEAQSTSVTSMPAHGIFGVQDKNNEEFYMVDTTSSPQHDGAVGRIGEFNTSGFDPSEYPNRQNLWDPFHEFTPGETKHIPYEGKKGASMTALTNFVTKNTTRYETQHEESKYFITDEWMDDAYKLLRNGGSNDPIVEPIEEMIQNSMNNEEGYTTGIYGSLDDTRIPVSLNDKIYEKVMYQTETQSMDDIETMLETA